MNVLNQMEPKKNYIVEDIDCQDEETKHFLFTLGCFKGATITLLKKMRSNVIVVIKDARYCMDNNLASKIIVS